MSELKQPVPAFHSDPDAAYAELGKTFVYVKQLSEALLERAREINEIDDRRIAAEERLNEIERQLGEARMRIAELESSTLRMTEE